jgi:hypothetical protein
LPALARLAERGTVCRIASSSEEETPEALWLGARPGEIALRPGPLKVSALGFDPPEDSLQFVVSALSLIDGIVQSPESPSPEERKVLIEAAKRLNAKRLTFLAGGEEHALVLEGRGALRTTPAREILNAPVRPALPEGDHEALLRRFVDDSTNLLMELEFNARRLDKGERPINLLWPWGHGLRYRVPNLALRRGEPLRVVGQDDRLRGLVRLTGDVRLAQMPPLSGLPILAHQPEFAVERHKEEGEERAARWLFDFDQALTPHLETARIEDPIRISILAPRSEGDGLGVFAELPNGTGGDAPFDDDVLHDPRIPRIGADDFVRKALGHE